MVVVSCSPAILRRGSGNSGAPHDRKPGMLVEMELFAVEISLEASAQSPAFEGFLVEASASKPRASQPCLVEAYAVVSHAIVSYVTEANAMESYSAEACAVEAYAVEACAVEASVDRSAEKLTVAFATEHVVVKVAERTSYQFARAK